MNDITDLHHTCIITVQNNGSSYMYSHPMVCRSGIEQKGIPEMFEDVPENGQFKQKEKEKKVVECLSCITCFYTLTKTLSVTKC